ncbi:hypothetical protein [Actinophytocola sp.]|uniref:hypothetical protein n=1 Tax=Actinophytocola sp. TaxID=1872138 RepID=UPI003D6B68A7
MRGPAHAPVPDVTTSVSPTLMPKRPTHPPGRNGAKPGADTPRLVPARMLTSAAAAVEPNTTLGAAVYDRTTGRFALELNAKRPFRSASLVKLLIAVDVLARGTDVEDRRRLARMLRTSDDGLASMFWVREGGPKLVTRTSAELGLHGVRPPEVPGQWGEVRLTAWDVVRIYQHVLELPSADRTLVVGALAQAPRHAADGFDQHFGIPDGVAGQWAVKQGWGNNGRAMVLHSTGLAGPGFRYVVVLLSEHPLSAGWQASARSVTAAAASMHGYLPGL